MQNPTYNKDLKIWSGSKVTPMFNPDQNLGQLILDVLLLSPDALSQISADTSVAVTCGEIRERVLKFSRHLCDLGLRQGDCVSVVAGNSENLAPAAFACFLLGLPVNPLAPIMLENDIVHVFSKTKPKLVLCDGHNLKTVQSAMKTLKNDAKIYTIMEDVADCDSVTRILRDTPLTAMTFPEVDSDSTLVIMVSSGSTSAPKGICKTHREIIACIVPVYDFGIDITPVVFQSTPMFWFSGLSLMLFSTLFRWVRVISAQPYHPKRFIDILDNYKVSVLLTPPFLIVNLMQSGFLKPLEHMRCWMIGGSAVTRKLIDTFQAFVPNAVVANTYASTEVNIVAVNLQKRKVESCGHPDANLQIKIIDDEGNALDNLQQGEICTKRGVQFSGYFEEPEKTKEAYDSDGWFKTGDIGYVDDEGFLFFVERKKEMLRYEGFTVTPTELEELINEMRGVVSSCVVGVFDAIHSNDIIHAFVIVDEASGLTETDIEAHVNGRVIDQKRLRGGVHFVKSFPLGVSGKVDKRIMRTMADEVMKK